MEEKKEESSLWFGLGRALFTATLFIWVLVGIVWAFRGLGLLVNHLSDTMLTSKVKCDFENVNAATNVIETRVLLGILYDKAEVTCVQSETTLLSGYYVDTK